MTKTFVTFGSHEYDNNALSAMKLSDGIEDGLIVWNFEIRTLGFIWDLLFGACDFSTLNFADNFRNTGKSQVSIKSRQGFCQWRSIKDCTAGWYPAVVLESLWPTPLAM